MNKSVLGFFNEYSLRARVMPAMIAVAPAIALILAIAPGTSGASQVFSGVIIITLTCAFADVARRFGKRLEGKIHSEMGGLPSITMLRYSDRTFDRDSKSRYHSFIGNSIPTTIPTEQNEIDDLPMADAFYKRCGNWLRENTRDTKKFGILFSENITYGFRRNLYGLIWIGLLVNAIVAVLCISHIYFGGWWHMNVEIGNGAHYVLLVSLVHAIYLVFFVTRNSVKEASNQYARQLILSCETLMKPSKKSKATKV